MDTTEFYFRQNVIVEPLFSQWYAWWYLISPATASLYVANQHLKIMQSFVAQPRVHVAAMKNPELLGGPYINYGLDRVNDIRQLLDKTTQQQAELLKMAAAVKALEATLAAHPQGMSLEEIYPKVPEPLRGYVELSYDVRNQPSFRFIEGLLYRSPYYNEAAQSLLLGRIDQDERPFIFSTPRLESPASLHVNIPFRHPSVDELMGLRDRPARFGHIQEMLGIPDEQADLLRSFLIEQPPRPAPARYDMPGVRIRYFGHACVLLESKDTTILTDPVLSYPYPTDLPRYTYEDLPARIDYVVITHTHPDHLMFETLLQLRPRIGAILVPKNNGSIQDPSIRLGLLRTGFKNVIEVEELDEIEVAGGSITGLPFLGEHGDLGIRSKLAFLVRLSGKSAVIAADSNALEPMLYSRIRDAIGPVDALFLGMECDGAPMSWSYGPLLSAQLNRKMDQSRRLSGSNAERASEIVKLLSPKQVYIYAMGQEPWLTHVMALKYTEASPQMVESNKLIEHCRAAGLLAERPYCQKELILS